MRKHNELKNAIKLVVIVAIVCGLVSCKGITSEALPNVVSETNIQTQIAQEQAQQLAAAEALAHEQALQSQISDIVATERAARRASGALTSTVTETTTPDETVVEPTPSVETEPVLTSTESSEESEQPETVEIVVEEEQEEPEVGIPSIVIPSIDDEPAQEEEPVDPEILILDFSFGDADLSS